MPPPWSSFKVNVPSPKVKARYEKWVWIMVIKVSELISLLGQISSSLAEML